MTGCLYPKFVYNKYLKDYVTVPCGHCAACRTLKSVEWQKRLQLESSYHKYCLFGTLTYANSSLPRKQISDCVFSDKESSLVVDSSDYIRFCNGSIPCVCQRDFALFIKRLRNYIHRDFNIPTEEIGLRYFSTSEYGPSTFRPHFHYLLWFDSEQVYSCIKECIYKAWKSKVDNPSYTSFYNRNKHQLVRFGAEKYVAGYLCCNSSLPPILQTNEFRAKHTCSIAPCIGFKAVSDAKIQQIFSDRLGGFTFKTRQSSKVVSLPLWRSIENRLFPRCRSFSSLSLSSRKLLYVKPYELAKGEGFSAFKSWFECSYKSNGCVEAFIRSIAFSGFEQPVEYCADKRLLDCLKRMYYVSKNFHRLCNYFGMDFDSMTSYISEYYSAIDYKNLVSQLQLEQEFATSPLDGFGLGLYPCFVDPCFAWNGRCLKNYNEYCNQFGFNPLVPSLGLSHNSYLWQRDKSSYTKICFENTKCRGKKDYLANNPQYANIYRTGLTSVFV